MQVMPIWGGRTIHSPTVSKYAAQMISSAKCQQQRTGITNQLVWVVTPGSPVYGYEHCSGIYCLHCQGYSEYGQGVGELHRKSGRGQTKEFKVTGVIEPYQNQWERALRGKCGAVKSRKFLPDRMVLHGTRQQCWEWSSVVAFPIFWLVFLDLVLLSFRRVWWPMCMLCPDSTELCSQYKLKQQFQLQCWYPCTRLHAVTTRRP
jgi:hypothetical protein